MLAQLHIQNFVIIDHLQLDFRYGLTVITGETGAGKSIIIDALSLLLGARADSLLVGPFSEKCSLTACFNVDKVPPASQWLRENDYELTDATECIIRRVLHRDGKSRQTINGIACTLQQLRDLLPLIVTLHSQNQHQQLGKRQHQLDLLDSFGNHQALCDQVKTHYQTWLANEKQIQHLLNIDQSGNLRQDLIEYQLSEFEKLAITQGEYEQLDEEHKKLAHAEQLLQYTREALTCLDENEDHSARNLLYQGQQYLNQINHYYEKISSTQQLVNDALIHLEEAIAELKAYQDDLELNPTRLNWVENRLSKLHELARKYQVSPNTLWTVHLKMVEQLEEISQAAVKINQLKLEGEALQANYRLAATQLQSARLKASHKLNKLITNEIQTLGMPGGRFKIAITSTDQISPQGSDEIEFLVAANPGQSLLPLTKTASGGEVSRIALAIYVTTAQMKTTPLLVFDEVDVGIGGGVAATVGKRLKSLGQHSQVIAITHLAQVAAYGQQHLVVKKSSNGEQTVSSITELTSEEKIKEIARMLGGITITEKTLAHAEELLAME